MSAQVSNGSTYPAMTGESGSPPRAAVGSVTQICSACVATVPTWSTAALHSGRCSISSWHTPGTDPIDRPNTM